MNIRGLHTLLSISQTGSFSVTAEQLNMTLPAVSMQMKALEENLGQVLFDRSARPPRLTSEARAILNDARVILDAQARIRAGSQNAGALLGRYRIGFIPTASVRILPGFLQRVSTEAPKAEFDTTAGLSADLARAVLAGTLEGAVVTGGALPAGLVCEQIAREPMALAVPEGVGNVAISALPDQLPFLQFLPDGGIGRVIDVWLNENTLTPKRRIIFDTVEPIIECLAHGLGYTILPRPDLERYPEKSFLIKDLPGKPISRDVVFISREHTMSAAHRAKILEMMIGG